MGGERGQEGPGVDGQGPVLRHGGQAGEEGRQICVISEDGPPLEPPHHPVVEPTRGIQARLLEEGTSVSAQDAIHGNA